MKNLKKTITNLVLKASLVVLALPVVFLAGLLVDSIVSDNEYTEDMQVIEQVIIDNEDVVSIEDSKYYEDMQYNTYYVASEVRDSNVEPVFTIEDTDVNGNEFTNEVYAIEFDGEIGYLVMQGADNVEDNKYMMIKYGTDSYNAAKLIGFYGYGVQYQ